MDPHALISSLQCLRAGWNLFLSLSLFLWGRRDNQPKYLKQIVISTESRKLVIPAFFSMQSASVTAGCAALLIKIHHFEQTKTYDET